MKMLKKSLILDWKVQVLFFTIGKKIIDALCTLLYHICVVWKRGQTGSGPKEPLVDSIQRTVFC